MKVSPQILNLVPYKPGKPISETQREYGLSNIVKLASNENPLGPSPMAIKAIETHLKEQHRYPDPSCHDLIQTLCKEWSTPVSKITIGNGSNELIDLMIRIFCEPGEAILTSEAAFVAYQVCAQAARVSPIFVPLKVGYKTDLEAMANWLEKSPEANKVRLVFIPNPNNPTGTHVSSDEVERFLKVAAKHDLLVVFDEAYHEFVRAKDYRSAMTLLSNPQVVVIKTMSKIYGLAGLRIGALLGNEAVIDLINRVRNPFNVNDLAQVAGIAAVQDREFIKKTVELTWQGLDYFYRELEGMGLPYVESQGNFVLFDTFREVQEVHVSLLKKGVILRPVQNYGFKTEMRMSVGLMSENQTAIKALKEVLPKIPVIKKEKGQ